MKYFKNDTGEVFAYESDGSQDKYIKPHLVLISNNEFLDLTQPKGEEVITITMAQTRKMLSRWGVSQEAILAHIEKMPESQEKEDAKIDFEYATEVNSNNILVNFVTKQMGMSENETYLAFLEAKAL